MWLAFASFYKWTENKEILFYCLLLQISNQPIMWQQLRGFGLLNMVKTTC